MSEFLGKEYNYELWVHSEEGFESFKSTEHAGSPPPDFKLPTLDGGDVRLSKLRGKPVMIEFGSIT